MQTELQIPSDLNFLPIVEDWMLGVLQIALKDKPDRLDWERKLRLVLVEAFSNVVRHAHAERPDIPIVIKLEVISNILCLEVWDQGQGFDLSTYLPPSPTSYQEGGYGWLILNRLMNKVEYRVKIQGHKNCLRLQADLSSENCEQNPPQSVSY